MRIKRMIFGNAAANGGEGWRTIRKTAQLSMKEEGLIKSTCSEALADTKTADSTRSIFYAKRFRKLLLLGYGAEQSADAHGRPGGWLFYCCACKPYHRGLADAIPLSRFLFDDCRSWLKQDDLELKEKDEQRVEAMIQNAGSIPADFWQDLHPLATSIEKELRFKHKRAKSYLFPAAQSVHFDVSRSIDSPPFQWSGHHSRWPLALSAIFAVVAIVSSLLLYHEKEKSRVQRGEHQNELSYQKRVHAEQISEKEDRIVALLRKVDEEQERANRAEQDAEAHLIVERDQALDRQKAMRDGLERLTNRWNAAIIDIKGLRDHTVQTERALQNLLDEAGSLLIQDGETLNE